MSVNWSLGFRRLAYALVALVWVVTLPFAVKEENLVPAIAVLLVFTGGFFVLCRILAWIARGFVGDGR